MITTRAWDFITLSFTAWLANRTGSAAYRSRVRRRPDAYARIIQSQVRGITHFAMGQVLPGVFESENW